MNDLPNRDLLFPGEIRKFLRMGRSTIYRLMEEGKIPAKKICGQWRIPRADFVKWFEKQPTGEDLLST